MLEEIMKPNKLYLSLSGFIILMTIVACVIPGQTTQPAPITNPSSVETAFASTARALAQQTETANGFTATPIIVPSDTLTPTPKISLAGASLVIRDDQSAVFTDHKAGIQLIVPAGWMPIRVNEEEYYRAFTLDVVLENQAFSNHLTNIQDANIDKFRLDAVDIRDGHTPDGILSNIQVIFEPGDLRSLEKWEQAERDRYHPFADFRFIASNYPQTANGTRVLVIEQSWSTGQTHTVYYRGVFFSLSSGTMVLDFYANNDFKDTVLPDFEQVVNSLTLLNP
jgi:hypothetical protein